MTASESRVVQIRSNDVSWREVDGEVIALDLRSSTYFTTNRTGTLLWHAMIDGATIDQLAALLRSSFGISDELAHADVESFLNLLVANGLLVRSG